MIMSDYVPTKDSDLVVYGSNFSGRIGADPALYKMTPAEAALIEAAASDYAAKYQIASDPMTRNAGTIINKDNARAALVAILRSYAMLIKENDAVPDDAKAYLGLGRTDTIRSSVAAPTTFPIVQVLAATPRQHELRFVDSGDTLKKGKPAGAIGLQLFCQVSEPGVPAPADPLSGRFQSLVTRPTFRMTFTAAEVDKRAHYYARWYTFTGLTGPWSQVASMTVAG